MQQHLFQISSIHILLAAKLKVQTDLLLVNILVCSYCYETYHWYLYSYVMSKEEGFYVQKLVFTCHNTRPN